MLIGFDLDGVFIDKPPLMPASLIDWLYRGYQTNGPTYRIPSKLEQTVRRLSHFYLFRPMIKSNVSFLQNSLQNPQHRFYLISSRFSFLQQSTTSLLLRYKLFNLFEKIILNVRDEQPHLFKEKMLQTLKVDLYVDDDLRLLEHLKKTCPKVKLLWYNEHSSYWRNEHSSYWRNRHSCQDSPLLDTIHHLAEIRKFLQF